MHALAKWVLLFGICLDKIDEHGGKDGPTIEGWSENNAYIYWQSIKESGWDKYPLVPTTQGFDSIVEHVEADHPDFSNLEALTEQIERETLTFIRDVESFLASHEN